MRKKLITFLCASIMSLSFVIPALAMETVTTVAVEPVNASAVQEISPFHEFTQFYWRWHNGQLQFRVWSITNGIWLTPWTDAI